MIPLVWAAPADQPPVHFDLTGAVRAALANSPQIEMARRTARADDRRADQSAAALRPSLVARADARRFDQATRIGFGGSNPPIEVLPEHSESLSIAATQRLDLFGQVRSATDQARLQRVADDLATRGAIRRRRLEATLAYVAVLDARGRVAVADAARAAAQTHHDRAQTLYDGGVGQKVDLLRARTALAQARQAQEAARNAEATARAAFNDIVGIALDAAVDLAPLPPADAVPDVAAAERAAGQRDDVLQAEVLARAAELGVTVARAASRPTVSLQATGDYYPTPSFQFPRQRTAAIGVSITVPLEDGGMNRARTDEARLRRENARTQRDATLRAARLEIRQAYLDLLTAVRQRDTAAEAAAQARAARDLAQVRYSGQVGLFLELSDAQEALVRAETAEVDAIHAAFAARARFESAAAPASEETLHG